MFFGIIGAIILISILIIHIRKVLFIKKNKEMILDTISCFYDEFEEMCNSFVCHSQEVEFVKKWKSKYNQISSFYISKNNELYSVVSNFIGDYENLHDMISLRNDMFIANEKVRCDALLSDIDGKSLDDQQRTAVVSDEDNSLVLAGAGSGKTLTIAGKVKYLYEERNINPDDILRNLYDFVPHSLLYLNLMDMLLMI